MNLIPWRNKKSAGDRGELARGASLTSFREEMDRLFDRFLSDPWAMPSKLFQDSSAWPAIEIDEGDDAVTVRAEVPGVDPKHLDVSISGDVLTLSGERHESESDSKRGVCYSEHRYGSFRRSIRLPAAVDPDEVSAEYGNGVLNLRMPKRPGAAARRITVKPAKE